MPEGRGVLVTGAGGQVGSALGAVLTDADLRTRTELDVLDDAAMKAAVRGKDVVVHLAALTDVDACEADPDRALAINSTGTGNVVSAARAYGARVIYVSTDFVFRGDDPPYGEDDPADPINVYGLSKGRGEECLDPDEGDLVVRTSWIFGARQNFVRTIVSAGQQGPVTVVDDQFGRPTSATGLALALAYLVDDEITGVLHVAGAGPSCSRADLAERALRHADSDAEVVRVDTEAHLRTRSGIVAPRPTDSTLRLDRAARLGVPLVDWRDALRAYVEGL